MSTRIKPLLDTLEHYFEGLRTSKRAPLERAFHPDARIVGPDDGELKVMDLERFIVFALQQPPDPELEADVLSIDVHGHIASAIVRDIYLQRVFIDHLALVYIDGVWRIFNKLWHVERKLSS